MCSMILGGCIRKPRMLDHQGQCRAICHNWRLHANMPWLGNGLVVKLKTGLISVSEEPVGPDDNPNQLTRVIVDPDIR
jgi:hypothetical protein